MRVRNADERPWEATYQAMSEKVPSQISSLLAQICTTKTRQLELLDTAQSYVRRKEW